MTSGDEIKRTDEAAAVDDLRALLQGIEQAALGLYARHGLPTAPGHYRSRAPDVEWEALGTHLSAADRWAMINDSAESGWRYASLEGLGARSEHADARQASAILSACNGLRQRLAGRTITAQDLADSIRLGAAWLSLDAAAASAPGSNTPLAFRPPDDLPSAASVETALTHEVPPGATASKTQPQ